MDYEYYIQLLMDYGMSRDDAIRYIQSTPQIGTPLLSDGALDVGTTPTQTVSIPIMQAALLARKRGMSPEGIRRNYGVNYVEKPATTNYNDLPIATPIVKNGKLKKIEATPSGSVSTPVSTDATTPVGKGAGLKGWFGNHFGQGKSLINGQLPKFGEMSKNFRQTNLYEGGPTLGNTANALSGVYQTLNIGKGISNLSQQTDDRDNLINDIKASAFNNPLAESYLTADQLQTLRKVKNGTYNTANFEDYADGAVKALPKALLGAVLGGLTGGVGGAIINGGGALASGALNGAANRVNGKSAELQGLFNDLHTAEQDYNDMRRPGNLRRAGLRRSAYNQLI